MYDAQITREHRGCFIFLVDQSGSMSDPFNADGSSLGRTKAEGVATAINRLLQETVVKCAKDEGVRPYFSVGLLGYGLRVGPAWEGALAGRNLVSITEIADSPLRIEERFKKVDDGAGGLVEQKVRFPVWLVPKAENGTPMCAALRTCHQMLQDWLGKNPTNYPPVVVHITDGVSTDGDPTDLFRQVTSLSTADGNVLLFNINLSSGASARAVVFPDRSVSLPDQYAAMLFEAASGLTPAMLARATELGLNVADGSRGFVLNADLPLVIQALDIGTVAVNLR